MFGFAKVTLIIIISGTIVVNHFGHILTRQNRQRVFGHKLPLGSMCLTHALHATYQPCLSAWSQWSLNSRRAWKVLPQPTANICLHQYFNKFPVYSYWSWRLLFHTIILTTLLAMTRLNLRTSIGWLNKELACDMMSRQMQSARENLPLYVSSHRFLKIVSILETISTNWGE